MSEKFTPPNLGLKVPGRIKHPEFQGSLLVAANIAKDKEGKALFGKVDHERVEQMMEQRLCQVCGFYIGPRTWLVFVGSMTLYQFQEAPMHVECARYAVQVCPHLWKKKDEIGMSVAKKYVWVPGGPTSWNDPYATPHYEKLSQMDLFRLSFAHILPKERNEDGKLVCTVCNQENLGKMTFDEFLKWSA